MSHIEPLVRRTLPGCLGMRRALNLLLFWWVATALSGELSQRGGREKNHGAEDDRENGYQFHSQSLPQVCVYPPTSLRRCRAAEGLLDRRCGKRWQASQTRRLTQGRALARVIRVQGRPSPSEG